MSSPSSGTRQIGYCGHSSSKHSSPFKQNIFFMASRALWLWKAVYGRAVSWSLEKQATTTLSRTETHWIYMNSSAAWTRAIYWASVFDNAVQRAILHFQRPGDRFIRKRKQIRVTTLFATRLLLPNMDDYIPQLKRYFLNRCLATVQNEKLRRTGTPPIPKPITRSSPAVPHLTPTPRLSLLHPNSPPG